MDAGPSPGMTDRKTTPRLKLIFPPQAASRELGLDYVPFRGVFMSQPKV